MDEREKDLQREVETGQKIKLQRVKYSINNPMVEVTSHEWPQVDI